MLASGAFQGVAYLSVLGDARVLASGVHDAGVDLQWRTYRADEAVDPEDGRIPVIDLGNLDPDRIERGRIEAESGRVTGETLGFAIDQAHAGRFDAITFAPLNKAALNAGGWHYPDEHQMFAHLTGHQGNYGEMNVLDGLWTARVTSHVALRDIFTLLSSERIVDSILLAHHTVLRATGSAPRIAVTALNPHAGENGLFGDEETTIIAPALDQARQQGIKCEGPFPADTIFLHAFADRYDAVVSMYHDQGQIAMKLKGFNRGVTVTAGLRTVFTTPAHGTAFDIVGRGSADPGALEQALRLAAQLASPAISLAAQGVTD
jgi:4-hydroxythreonine-4-phosphate dehydrogenase